MIIQFKTVLDYASAMHLAILQCGGDPSCANQKYDEILAQGTIPEQYQIKESK